MAVGTRNIGAYQTNDIGAHQQSVSSSGGRMLLLGVGCVFILFILSI